MLPHEARLPHADVISERLETLVALTHHASRITHHAPLIVTSVAALLQRTFPAGAIREHTRTLRRGDRLDPLDLVEWLEEQGYEPEAQVTQKGEIALRGGILDVYPLTSPWPVRLEFFGDELESLRQFDPLTQMSREAISEVTIPPAGELGLLKKSEGRSPKAEVAGFGTLLDYLPPDTVFALCEPEVLAERADEYAGQVPEGDPFFISWETFLEQARERGMTLVEASDADAGLVGLEGPGGAGTTSDAPSALSPTERENASPGGDDSERFGTDPERVRGSLSLRERVRVRGNQTLVIPHRLNHPPGVPSRTPHSALRTSRVWRRSVRCRSALRSRRSLRPSGANSSPNCTAGCARAMRFTSSATTTASGSASSRFGTNTAWCRKAPKPRPTGSTANDPAGLQTLDSRLRTHLGTLARGFLCDEARAGRGDGRGDLRALQGAAAAPAQITARAGDTFGAGH